MNVKLYVEPSDGEPFEYVMSSESVVIGRSRGSDLKLNDRYLSRHHARIFRRGSLWMVEDLGSQNGTWLNDRRVRGPQPFEKGAVIRVSDSSITVRDTRRQKESKVPRLDSIFIDATQLLDLTESAAELQNEGESWPTIDRLRLLNEVHQALAESIDRPSLLDLLLKRLLNHLHPEQASLYLRDDDDQVVLVASQVATGKEGVRLNSRNLVEEVVDKGMAALVHDLNIDERFSGAESLVSSGVRSLIAAPLLGPKASLGMIVLSSKLANRRFTEEDMALLVSLASVAALRLRNLALAEEAAQRARLEQELGLARRIQTALLPLELPSVEGYELRAENTPSAGVSGDFFQVLTRNEGTELVIMVADVSGKGMSASLLTASLEALSAAPIEDGFPPQRICGRLSRMLYKRTPPERYATLFLAVIDLESGKLTFSNAGHNPAVLIHSDGALDILSQTGIPAGMFTETEYTQGEKELEPGSLLVIYTDGLTEAVNAEDEEYGQDRLVEQLVNNKDIPLDQIIQNINDHQGEFVDGVPYGDDRTLVVLRRL